MEKKQTTIVLFSGDYDKAMAAYIIANGAAAYDHEVTIFHTFWGINALGLQKEELLDGIEYAGVAAYLADAENGNVNLFI